MVLEEQVLAGSVDSPVVPETAAEDVETAATTDAEDSADTPKRGGPRYKDLYAQTQKELETLRTEAARRDEAAKQQIAEATRAMQDLIAVRQQEMAQQSVARTDREIETRADTLAEQRGWDTYTRAEWVEGEKRTARKLAEADAKLAMAEQKEKASEEAKAQANALRARPRQVAQEIATATEKFAARYKLDKDLLKIDPVQVIAKLNKDPWVNGAVEEAQEVIRDLLDDAKERAESVGRQQTLADRAKNGTDVMPQGTSGARSARQVWQAWADGDPNTTRQDAEKARAVLKRQGALR